MTNYEYSQTDDSKGWQYMFFVGQNNDTVGQVGSFVVSQSYEEINKTYSDRKHRMEAFFKAGISLVKDRGIMGNLKFYIKKLNVAYNDGQFHNVQCYNGETVEKNIWYEIYCSGGKYYKVMAGMRQILWDFLLCLISADILFCLMSKKKRLNTVIPIFQIIILGITIYLMLFEGRSKYLYMFLPVYISLAGIMLDEILKVWISWKMRTY